MCFAESLPQLRPGVREVNACRSRRDAQLIRDLLVAETFEVVQQHDLPFGRSENVERGGKLPPQLSSGGIPQRVLPRADLSGSLERNAAAPGPVASSVVRPVPSDREEPSAKTCWIPALFDARERGEKRFLHHVFRVGRFPELRKCDRVSGLQVPPNQEIERGRISIANTSDEILITIFGSNK